MRVVAHRPSKRGVYHESTELECFRESMPPRKQGCERLCGKRSKTKQGARILPRFNPNRKDSSARSPHRLERCKSSRALEQFTASVKLLFLENQPIRRPQNQSSITNKVQLARAAAFIPSMFTHPPARIAFPRVSSHSSVQPLARHRQRVCHQYRHVVP